MSDTSFLQYVFFSYKQNKFYLSSSIIYNANTFSLVYPLRCMHLTIWHFITFGDGIKSPSPLENIHCNIELCMPKINCVQMRGFCSHAGFRFAFLESKNSLPPFLYFGLLYIYALPSLTTSAFPSPRSREFIYSSLHIAK